MPNCGPLSRVTVEPVLFLYMLGIYLLYGVIQDLIYQRVCLAEFSSEDCETLGEEGNEDKLHLVQTEASRWIKYSTLCFVFPSILVDVYMGSWSDIVGRKVPLLLPPTGAALSSVVYAVMAAYPSSHVGWILLASFLQGIFGAFSSLLTGVLAYVSAITGPHERTARFSVLVSMSFVAGLVGPILSTQLASSVSHLFVFCLIGVCHLSALAYVACCVRNILPLNDDERNNTSLLSLKHLSAAFRTCFCGDDRWRLLLLMLMAFTLMVLQSGELDIAYLYLANSPLSFDLGGFGIWFGLRYGLSSLALLLVLPLLKKLTDVSDYWTCAVGLCSKAAALVLLGLSVNKQMVYGEVVVGSLAQFALTSLRSMMSQCVQEQDQGKLLGLFAVFEDCSILLGTLVFNSVYPLTRPIYAGIPFLSSAAAIAVLVAPALLVVFLLERSRTNRVQPEETTKQ